MSPIIPKNTLQKILKVKNEIIAKEKPLMVSTPRISRDFSFKNGLGDMIQSNGWLLKK